MKITIETKDKEEARRLLASNNMANFIWELVHNGWREFKHTDYNYERAWAKINSMLEEHNIVIDDLVS